MSEKVAIVFHGIRGGMAGHNGDGEKVNIADCAVLIKRNVISKYDCDVFIHSWSIEDEMEIRGLYDFTASLFEPQEYFGFDADSDLAHPWTGQAFRTISRYTSLERALELKNAHERQNNFQYKWVVVLRLDLVFFNAMELSKCDNNRFYGCYIPEWNSLHDLLFVANSKIMNDFGTTIISDIRDKKLNPNDAHELFMSKLRGMFASPSMYLNYVVKRYDDVEVYRWVTQQQCLRPEGNKFGNMLMKARFEALLSGHRGNTAATAN